MKKRKRGGHQYPDLCRLRLNPFMSGVVLAGIGACGRAKDKVCGDRKKVGDSKEQTSQELRQKGVEQKSLNRDMEGYRE